DHPSLLTPVGLRPPSVNKLVSSTITLLLFQSHIIDKRTFYIKSLHADNAIPYGAPHQTVWNAAPL
ncbi:MAG: hypothetical protein SOV91_06685, partial [Eubacteriales bacterium]|nr:hypothetical protein [Eubacteriales bacterium]